MAKLTKKDVDARFAKAQEGTANAGGFEKLPPGRYKAKLTKCEFYEAKSGKLFIRHFWKVLEGEQEGEVAQDYRGVETENGITYTLMEWKKLGVDTSVVNNYESLDSVAKFVQSQGFICTLRIATNRNNAEYQNFYIDALIDSEPEDGEAEWDDAAGGLGSSDSKVDNGSDSESEDDAEIDIGDTVEFMHDGEKIQKPVFDIDEDEGKIKVKVNRKVVELTVDEILQVVK